jgi:hypothetical protein
MKPVIQIWVTEEGLQSIVRGQYPSSWWRRTPELDPLNYKEVICISVTCDWFVNMRDYEKTLEKDNDLPF